MQGESPDGNGLQLENNTLTIFLNCSWKNQSNVIMIYQLPSKVQLTLFRQGFFWSSTTGGSRQP